MVKLKAKWREKSLIQDSSFICEGKFNALFYINLSYKVPFPPRPFRRHESRTHCCSLANYQDSGIYSWGMHLIRWLQLHLDWLRNAFGFNRWDLFWRALDQSNSAGSFIFRDGKTQFSAIVPWSNKIKTLWGRTLRRGGCGLIVNAKE